MGYSAKIILQLPLSNPDLLDDFVEACIRDGVTLIAVVGEGCRKTEDIIDELIVADGSDQSRFSVTTTSHPDETMEEVIEFASIFEPKGTQSIELVRL
jgi:hypothetical protein